MSATTANVCVKPVPRLSVGVRNAYLLIALVSALGLFHVVPVYVHMLTVTMAVIFIGSVSSIKSHADEGAVAERMETKDAMMFPLLGSAVLFSLYIVFKVFPKEYVNLIIKAYFFIFGIGVLATKIEGLLERVLPVKNVRQLTAKKWKVTNPISKIPYLGSDNPEDAILTITPLLVLSFAVAVMIGVYYLSTGHWLASNIFGMAFSIQGIELLSLGSYLNGLILLTGLFFYDIFWVFGTEVMVTVAKSFDAPIKLLFPQTTYELSPSMLGLGDIVIPGIFIALLLRYDYMNRPATAASSSRGSKGVNTNKSHHRAALPHIHAHSDESPVSDLVVSPSTTPYFVWNLVSYFVGLSTTVFVMYSFKAAQPALLYLVPACLGGSALVALQRGELTKLFKYSESDHDVAPPATSAAAEVARKDQ